MRIAYILPYLTKPGGWRSHANAFINAIRQEVQPVLIVAAADKEIARGLFPQDMIIPVPATQEAALNKLSGMVKFATTYRAIQQGHFPQVDLVHSLEAYPTGLVGDWLARRLNCPHVLTVNGTYGVVWVQSFLDRRVYARVLSQAAVVIPASQGTAGIMQQTFGEALRRTPVVPIVHGNNYYKDIPHQAAWERSTPQIPTLLTIGQLKTRKGVHISLAAFIQVKKTIPGGALQNSWGYI
jgi:glycosyltransferase involved in cell wall biosynthesis